MFSNRHPLNRTVGLVLLIVNFGAQPAHAADLAARPTLPAASKRANFDNQSPSREVRYLADWVVDSADNRSLPFVILDKKEARVFVFYADGQIRSSAAALLGAAVGDDSVPGIGDRKLASIRPEERTTPAGRFVASLDRNLHGKQMLWVDYDSAISMHPVITSNPQERRAERLATPTPLDNRISYGCINVPPEFFKQVVIPAFTGTNGIVYVLPEIRALQKVFAAYDVDQHARVQLSAKIDTNSAQPR